MAPAARTGILTFVVNDRLTRNGGDGFARHVDPFVRQKNKDGMPRDATSRLCQEMARSYCTGVVDEATVAFVNVAPVASWKIVLRWSVPNER